MSMQADGRPDPDALLARSRREGRGRLKVFLGAAPGVGKTFAMLSAAARLARAQVDVLVGVVETHGRKETEALLAGLDILPRRAVAHGTAVLTEFDLDAALSRHPALLVVDELAHTNAPGSRHPKRYQDVDELLDAGIDVWTAVNIQHLEGLSDVVARITGVTVRETVPDTIIETADEVVVVDITPDELLQRLTEGRIYLPENARRAAEGFFKPANLTALRELALRRTADRVDDQVLDHLKRHAIEGAWPSGERILVCVGADVASEQVIRAAARLASGLNAPWTAVTLEQVGREIADDGVLQRIDQAMRLAERLGAETMRLSARDLTDTLLRLARRLNVTQIVIGRSASGRLARMRGRSLSDALLREAQDIAIHVVVTEAPARRAWHPRAPSRLWAGLAAAVGSVAMAVGVGMAASRYLPLPNLDMMFLAAVLVCAATLGVWAAVAAAVLSFLAYNFFFIPPLYTFTVAEPREVLALVIFLMVAILTGGLAGRVREQSDAARKRVTTIQALYDVSRKLSGSTTLDDVLWVIARQVAEATGRSAVVLMPADGAAGGVDLEIRAAFPPEDTLAPGELAAARWAFAKAEPAGWRTGTLPQAHYRFLPIATGRGTLAVVGFEPATRDRPLSKEDERNLAALLEQAAVAVERALLVADVRKAETLAERERLQATLLSSLSHDLRTPLSVILGAATSLRSFGARMVEADRADLLATIEEEAARLARFLANLLDMTRVEAGASTLRQDDIDVVETLATATARARKAFPARPIDVAVPDRLPPVRGDAVLFEQVIFNLFDNADRYSAPGTPTRVAGRGDDSGVTIAVEDSGRGIPLADLERVFGKFIRLEDGDGRPAGTGLGLAIAHGVVEAMGGSIRAESPAREGGRHPHRDPPSGRGPAGAPADAQARGGALSRPRAILVVDDEPQIHRFLRPTLAAAGFGIETALTGRDALKAFAALAPELVLLDLGLPDMDGVAVLDAIRQVSRIPVIILSAREDEATKVLALDAGADDFVNKPFSVPELMARIRTALRHATTIAGDTAVFQAGDLMVDTLAHRVTLGGEPLKLTPIEFDLLLLLARYAGRVLTHHHILKAVWGPAHVEDAQYLRVFIRRLRRKIEADPADPRLLLTESGVGYRLAVPDP